MQTSSDAGTVTFITIGSLTGLLAFLNISVLACGPMDKTRLQIVCARDAFDACELPLIQTLLGLIDFRDSENIRRIVVEALSRHAKASLRDGPARLDETTIVEMINAAANEMSCWLTDKIELSGIPVQATVSAVVGVGRHKFLSALQHQQGLGGHGPNFARRITQLIGQLDQLERRLKLAARLTARAARKGKLFPPHPTDLRSVTEMILIVFPETMFQAERMAQRSLDDACVFIHSLARERFNTPEFDVDHLPSAFVADAAFDRFRHVLLSEIEDFF